MSARKIILSFVFLQFISSIFAQTDVFVLDAATNIPSSPVTWTLYNLQRVNNTDLQIESSDTLVSSYDDLFLEFETDALLDSASNWITTRNGQLQITSSDKKFGNKSLFTRAPDGKISLTPAKSALFVPNTVLPSFSIEFWAKPKLAANGEIVFMWKGSRQNGKNWFTQQISCVLLQNRLRINFINVFFNDGKEQVVTLASLTPVIPEVWVHYMIRYNSVNGLIELVKDGQPEAVQFLTVTGHENGKLLAGLMGTTISFELAPNYTGYLDNFRISGMYKETIQTRKYSLDGGYAVSPVLDMGAADSRLKKIQAQIVGDQKNAAISYKVSNTIQGLSQLEWSYLDNNSALQAFGRYLQLRYELFPDATGSVSPIVKKTTIEWESNPRPRPPRNVIAVAGNGSITVYWAPSNETDIKGYILYYGAEPGLYFGKDAAEGMSPIIIYGSSISSFTLTGLKNGALYFIAIAAFDDENAEQIGEFSVETNARPMRKIQ